MATLGSGDVVDIATFTVNMVHINKCTFLHETVLVNFGIRSGENISEWRSRDRDGSGGGKPWQNKDAASWKEENGERSAKGKWGGLGDGGRSRSGKWNSQGDNEWRGKSCSFGSESGISV